jgi:hypothetical protein
MTRRTWIAVAAAVAIVAVAGLGVLYTISRNGRAGAGDDCQVAREMIAYNKSQGQLLSASFNPEQEREASVDDYRLWAGRLHTYSARISAPEIAAPATRMAAEADQLVAFVEHIRNTVPTEDPTAPMPGVQQYGDLARQFHDNLVALNQACPRQS